MEEKEFEWREIRLPRGFGGHRGCVGGQTYLHLWEAGDRWSIYVSEERVDEPQISMDHRRRSPVVSSHFVSWGIQFDGNEICGGALKTVRSAKDVALTVLAALMDGPEPDVPDDEFLMPGPGVIPQ